MFPRDTHVICELDEDGKIVYRAGCVRVCFGNGAVVEKLAGGYECVAWENMRAAREDEIENIERDWLGVVEGMKVDTNALDALRRML